ncbi:uncharacterized protein G2W53_028322 [Senna tora]|uniref:Uncharacterized protein n=1 Tax=Senna tora TaxID=362788 RepID=A0A834WAI9_9FABA|nr:uncharacterized protein G2W53_028322 [Senna tora]
MSGVMEVGLDVGPRGGGGAVLKCQGVDVKGNCSQKVFEEEFQIQQENFDIIQKEAEEKENKIGYPRKQPLC